jgi:hypothetical protein
MQYDSKHGEKADSTTPCFRGSHRAEMATVTSDEVSIRADWPPNNRTVPQGRALRNQRPADPRKYPISIVQGTSKNLSYTNFSKIFIVRRDITYRNGTVYYITIKVSCRLQEDDKTISSAVVVASG